MDDGKYRVYITTANRAAAGISSTVYIKMLGERGAMRPLELGTKEQTKDKKHAFSRGMRSEFRLQRDDVGQLKYIEVWHSDDKAFWDCQSIEIARGNDMWKFTPKEPIPSQKDKEIVVPTKLVGVYSSVTSGSTPFHTAARDGKLQAVKRMFRPRSTASTSPMAWARLRPCTRLNTATGTFSRR